MIKRTDIPILLTRAGVLISFAGACLFLVLPLTYPRPVPAIEPEAYIPDALSRVDEIEQGWLGELPPFSSTFMGWEIGVLEDEGRAIRAPSKWEKENTTHAGRVESYNRYITRLEGRYVGTSCLLSGIFMVCAAAFAWTLRRIWWTGPSVVVLACLFTTPIATEPILGVDYSTALAPFVALPFLLALPLLVLGIRSWLDHRRKKLEAEGRQSKLALALVFSLPLFLGGLGVLLIALGVDEKIDFLVQVGASLLAGGILGVLFLLYHFGREALAWMKRRKS